MCKKNVQTGCTGYIHIAAIRMVENNEYLTVYSMSHVDANRQSLRL